MNPKIDKGSPIPWHAEIGADDMQVLILSRLPDNPATEDVSELLMSQPVAGMPLLTGYSLNGRSQYTYRHNVRKGGWFGKSYVWVLTYMTDRDRIVEMSVVRHKL